MSDLKKRKSDRRPQLDRIRVEVACNDERGHFAGKFEALCFAAKGERIGLDLRSGSAPRFKELPDGCIYVYRRRCDVLASREWYGNWCWNAYVITLPMAAWWLTHAVSKGRFGLDMAEGDHACRISDLIDQGSITPSEAMLYLGMFGN